MPRINKKQPAPASAPFVSRWEAIWTAKDYAEHDDFFTKMAAELKALAKRSGPLTAKDLWLEKQKCAKIRTYMGVSELVVTNPESFSIHTAMYSKFTDWLYFRERKSGKKLPSLKELVGNKLSMSIARKTPPTIDVDAANTELALAAEEEREEDDIF